MRKNKVIRRYILSAGRTGTVFLTHLLNTVEGVKAVHEPSPSRWQMMLANARNDFGIGGSLLRSWFNRTRCLLHDKGIGDGHAFIELNPFLCALSDLIPEDGVETRVVHLVRHPEEWAASMSVFKASTRYRHVIDYIPFAKPYPAPRPEGWSHLSEFEKALWRWRWCNERLLALSKSATDFHTVHSEDLFGEDLEKRDTASKALFEGLALPGGFPQDFADSERHRNARPKGDIEKPQGAVVRICGPLAAELGYDV
ncbi:MAG: hypothetical protein PVF65_11225 [Sphingomonadales bacterium]|jgi:hypothetical protein